MHYRELKNWLEIIVRRRTVIPEFLCVAVGVLLAVVCESDKLCFALTTGGAASAIVALLIDVRSAIENYEEERQRILNFDRMISPLICRWVELYIYISGKNLVQSSALANTVQTSDRCGVDLMPDSFNLDDMVNMFRHPFLMHFPMNTPVVELFADNAKKMEAAIELFLNCNSLENFRGVKAVLLDLVGVKRRFDVSKHILEDKLTTLSGVTFWNQFVANASSLVAQFPPHGKGNPIYNHYFVFMEMLKAERGFLVHYKNEIVALQGDR